MSVPVVVCHGREVDDHGQPRGERCGKRFVPPARTAPEALQMAAAGGWSVAPPDFPDHTEQELVGMCPGCRRPSREAVALAKEVASRAAA